MAVRRRATKADDVSAELAALRVENARLRERLDALCQAADLWISLYERQLGRANQLIAECRRLRGTRPTVTPRLVPSPRPLRLTLASAPRRRKRAGRTS